MLFCGDHCYRIEFVNHPLRVGSQEALSLCDHGQRLVQIRSGLAPGELRRALAAIADAVRQRIARDRAQQG